jgi:hypothetical protein
MTLRKTLTSTLRLFKNANLIKAYLILNPFSYVFFTCTLFLYYLNINMRAEKQNSVAMLPKISIGFSPEVRFHYQMSHSIHTCHWNSNWRESNNAQTIYFITMFSFLSPIIKTVPIGSTFLYILLDHANII